MTRRGCSNCAMWNRFEEPGRMGMADNGQCRRHAPRPSFEGRRPDWPETSSFDWCGEHRA